MPQLESEMADALSNGLTNPDAVRQLVKQLVERNAHVPERETIEAAFQALATLEQW